jgi:hypothetical protein
MFTKERGFVMKGLVCDIFKSDYNSDLNVIASKCNSVTLVGEGIPEIFNASDDAPAVTWKKIANTQHIAAVPEGETKWVMFGGTFIYTSDSRFPAEYPIPLHDRIEY